MSLEKVLVCLLDALFQAIAATMITIKQIGERPFKDKMKFFVSIYIYFVICYLFIPNQLRFVLYIFFASLILSFSLKINDKKMLIYSFNSEVIASISELIISLLLVILGLDSVDIVNNDFYNLLANLLISGLSIILINIKFIYKILIKIVDIFDKNSKFTRYFYVFIFILYLLLLKNGFEFLMKSNYYINIFFIMIAIAILYIITKNELKYEQLNEQNKQMLNYVTKYEKIITEQGKANHEFKNQLMVIRGYAQMNSPKLIDYLDSIVDDIKKTQSSYLISNLNKFPDGGIKGLLYYKLSIMDDENIKYEINVEDGIKSKLNSLNAISYKNITKILGVLLDNAIEASRISESKKIIIMVECENKNVDFKLYNSYAGNIEISKIGTGYTTKGNGHGFGLKLVQDVVNSSSQLSTEYFLESEYYVSILHIKISQKKKTKLKK